MAGYEELLAGIIWFELVSAKASPDNYESVAQGVFAEWLGEALMIPALSRQGFARQFSIYPTFRPLLEQDEEF